MVGSNEGAQEYREREEMKHSSDRRMSRGQASWSSAPFDTAHVGIPEAAAPERMRGRFVSS